MGRTPYNIVEMDGKPVFEVQLSSGDAKPLTPEEFSAIVLRKMKRITELDLGEAVTYATVAIPADTDENQASGYREAFKDAGLGIMGFSREPSAAVLAYDLPTLYRHEEREFIALVYILGASYLEVSVVLIEDGFDEILATSRSHIIYPDDHDFYRHGTHSGTSTPVNPELVSMELLRQLTQQAFDEVHEAAVSASYSGCKIDTHDHYVKESPEIPYIIKEMIDDIIMVVDSSYVPEVQALIEELFNGKKVLGGIKPDEIITTGVAKQAERVSWGGGCTLPMFEINTLALGIRTTHGQMTEIIPRSSALPTRKSQIFSTETDNQTSFTVAVFEGQRRFAYDNLHLVDFELTGIPPAPRGVPQIEVAFELSYIGYLEVSAHEKTSGQRQSVTIWNLPSSFLDEKEIGDMVNNAGKAAKEDNYRINTMQAWSQDRVETEIPVDQDFRDKGKETVSPGVPVPSAGPY